MRKVFTTTDALETQALAGEVLRICPREHIFLLKGDLGAGKTTFVKGMGRALGVEEIISSPTFVIMRTFEVSGHPRFHLLCHVDLYRLPRIDEETLLALEEMMARDDVLVSIEWPERFGDDVPSTGVMLEYEHIDEFKRRITLTCPPETKH